MKREKGPKVKMWVEQKEKKIKNGESDGEGER